MDSHGAYASGAADDEQGFAGIVGRGVDVQPIEERFPCGQAGEGQRRAGGGIELGRPAADDALVNELVVGIGAGASDVAGVVDGIAHLKEGDGVTDGLDRARGIVAKGLRFRVRAWAHLGIDRIETDRFDAHENIVSFGGRSRELDFERCVGLVEGDAGLELDGFHVGGHSSDGLGFASVDRSI